MMFYQIFKLGKKFLRYFSGQISYKKSLVLSVFFHGLLFVLLSLMLNPFQISDSPRIALVIDLGSVPADEDRDASFGSEKEIVEPSLKKNHFDREISSHSITSSIQLIEQESQTNEFDNSKPNSNNKNHSKFVQPYFASIFVPPSVKFPRIDFAEPKLLPAKMPLSEQQEKTLLKQVTKLTEKPGERELPDTTLVFEKSNQKFEIQIQHLPAKSATELDEVLFDITTQENGKMLSTQVRTRRLAFSNFAQLVDYWDPLVAVHDDVFEGRFHSNYAFAISRSKGIGPQFHGKVTTAAYDVKTSGDFPIIDQNSIFIEGIETGVKQIRLPQTFSPFSDHSKLNRDQVLMLSEESWITFQQDGSYTWRSKFSPAVEHRAKISALSFFIVGDKGAKIHVKGTVNGKVLVYSADDVIIDNDLFYAHSPEKLPNSNDYLGLVSERNIEIAHPSVTGSGDFHVYAAIYARGWFRIPNLNSSGEAILYIYGSLSAGSLTATEPRYATHIRFDKRLETRRPPNFPLTERYEIVDWDKTWEIKKQ